MMGKFWLILTWVTVTLHLGNCLGVPQPLGPLNLLSSLSPYSSDSSLAEESSPGTRDHLLRILLNAAEIIPNQFQVAEGIRNQARLRRKIVRDTVSLGYNAVARLLADVANRAKLSASVATALAQGKGNQGLAGIQFPQNLGYGVPPSQQNLDYENNVIQELEKEGVPPSLITSLITILQSTVSTHTALQVILPMVASHMHNGQQHSSPARDQGYHEYYGPPPPPLIEIQDNYIVPLGSNPKGKSVQFADSSSASEMNPEESKYYNLYDYIVVKKK